MDYIDAIMADKLSAENRVRELLVIIKEKDIKIAELENNVQGLNLALSGHDHNYDDQCY